MAVKEARATGSAGARVLYWLVMKGPLPPAVVAAIEQGRLIDAIKLLRESTGSGLKDAKDAVDEYVRSHPELAMKLKAQQAEMNQALLRWGLILLLTALGAYSYLRG